MGQLVGHIYCAVGLVRAALAWSCIYSWHDFSQDREYTHVSIHTWATLSLVYLTLEYLTELVSRKKGYRIKLCLILFAVLAFYSDWCGGLIVPLGQGSSGFNSF